MPSPVLHRGYSWPLGRKLGLTAWFYMGSILINIVISTVCILVYFQPAFRQSKAGFGYQQQLEAIRGMIRQERAIALKEPMESPQSPPVKKTTQVILDAVLSVEGNPPIESGASEWEGVRETARSLIMVDVTPAEKGNRLALLESRLTLLIKRLSELRYDSQSRAFRTQQWILRILIVNSFLGAVLCSLGLWFVRRWVVKPVVILKQATDKIRKGDFDPEIALPFEDEMGKLGHEIEHMAHQLDRLQEQLIDRERHSVAEEMIDRVELQLRDPLSSIHRLAETCAQRNTSHKDVHESQQRIVATVSRFRDWLHQLRTGLSYTMGTPQPVALSEILSNVFATVQPTLDRHQITLQTNVTRELDKVSVDTIQFEHVLVSLITNAVQASTAGQRVRVSVDTCKTPSGWWQIEVADEGCGIPPELLDKIFQPFFTTKHDGNGIGLGLAKSIVQQHGGELLVSSQPGHGSSFTVRLPGAIANGN